MKLTQCDCANSKQPQSDAPHYVWQYFAITHHADMKKGTAKNAVHMFVTICSTSRAIAHILGSPVLGQHKAGTHP